MTTTTAMRPIIAAIEDSVPVYIRERGLGVRYTLEDRRHEDAVASTTICAPEYRYSDQAGSNDIYLTTAAEWAEFVQDQTEPDIWHHPVLTARAMYGTENTYEVCVRHPRSDADESLHSRDLSAEQMKAAVISLMSHGVDSCRINSMGDGTYRVRY